MGRKNSLNVYVTPTQAIPLNSPSQISPSVSLSSSFNTISTFVQNQDNISYQIVITSSDSTGTFTLQCSSDNVNWTTVGTAATVSAANDIATIWVNQEYCSPYIRLHYASTIAGTGSCNIILSTKDIGA